MSCGCGCNSAAPCGRPKRPDLCTLRPGSLQNTLGQALVPVADTMRNLNTVFGIRPYVVRVIRTSWTGGARGLGAEVVKEVVNLLPTPLMTDMSGLSRVVNPVGLDEMGKVKIDQISGFYTEDQLMGLDPGAKQIGPDEQVFYEVEFVQPNGAPGIKRRFTVRGVPNYKADALRWWVTLEKAVENRLSNNDPGSTQVNTSPLGPDSLGPFGPPDVGNLG